MSKKLEWRKLPAGYSLFQACQKLPMLKCTVFPITYSIEGSLYDSRSNSNRKGAGVGFFL